MTKKNIDLPEALDAPREALRTQSGVRLAYYADRRGQGRPIVLIHSINAAASSFEVRPLFEHYAGRRPVYSLDLPGFGHSDRASRDYSPELYAEAIAALLTSVVVEAADLVALSLSCEFAARAALLAPDHVASLVLISPTGFSRQSLPSPGVAGTAARILNLPVLSQRLYDLVASRRSIAYFLGLCFVGQAPKSMIDYAYATSHQPGARHAPLAFLSTRLFTPDATDRLYGALGALRGLVIADQDPFVTFDRLDAFLLARPSWQRVRLAPHKGLPHWENPEDTVETLDQFWRG
ncbi:alpha/beta fold hydrolase [Thiocystis violacea]|uniref:alpha/beta fold hydrolase n=1 Tax=Thiocystis violacea TaxID=13725 RepID=UPI0019073855